MVEKLLPRRKHLGALVGGATTFTDNQHISQGLP